MLANVRSASFLRMLAKACCRSLQPRFVAAGGSAAVRGRGGRSGGQDRRGQHAGANGGGGPEGVQHRLVGRRWGCGGCVGARYCRCRMLLALVPLQRSLCGHNSPAAHGCTGSYMFKQQLVSQGSSWLAPMLATRTSTTLPLSMRTWVRAGAAGPDGSGSSPLEGLTVVVLGAGGAGRALAFGAAERGARVIICNRCAVVVSMQVFFSYDAMPWTAVGRPQGTCGERPLLESCRSSSN